MTDENRRATDQSRMERVVEHKFARFSGRYVVPVVLAAGLSLISVIFHDMRTATEQNRSTNLEQTKILGEIAVTLENHEGRIVHEERRTEDLQDWLLSIEKRLRGQP